MSLLEQLKNEVLDVLAPRGWGELFKKHGLNISVPLEMLETELIKPLLINRTILGFEEFAFEGYRAIEPGRPGYSFLYHALASANVRPVDGGIDCYPSFLQLDIVENFIYSRSQRTIDSVRDPVIAIFSYQYRDRHRTTHRCHADMVFARVGVARVGNHPPKYDPVTRGYDPSPDISKKGFRVLPARYAVFLAERRTQTPNGAVMRGVQLDQGLTFLFPVHKLFEGDECLFAKDKDNNLKPINIEKIHYVERHVNEKLARVHMFQDGDNPGFVEPMENPSFDLAAPPFLRDSINYKDLIQLVNVGASCIVEPIAAPLVRMTNQIVNGREELVRFKVPPLKNVNNGSIIRPNRYWSTLELTANGYSRSAPEYLNIRQEVISEGDSKGIQDLNLAKSDEFDRKVINNGGYEAAHFIDNACDGALTIHPLKGIKLPYLCAYSIISAVDFLPHVDQIDVQEWLEKRQKRSIGLTDNNPPFTQGGPQPMSDGRFLARDERDDSDLNPELIPSYQLPNCTLPHPLKPNLKAFDLLDITNFTVTSIVGNAAKSGSLGIKTKQKRTLSWLPDSAADVYAPGWDVSQHLWQNQNMMVSYGLGSPFPEDAKLCAALNSFWPAAAPDSSRTYGYRPPKLNKALRLLPTAFPLLDSELGYHDKHPRVIAGEVVSNVGWDGDFGPYILKVSGMKFVNASNPLRADMTRAALDGKVWFSGLDNVTTDAYLTRMNMLAFCLNDFVSDYRRNVKNDFDLTTWWLVTFEEVESWANWKSQVIKKASDKLSGYGAIFKFVRVIPGENVSEPPLRQLFKIEESFEIQIAEQISLSPSGAEEVKRTVYYRRDNKEFSEMAN